MFFLYIKPKTAKTPKEDKMGKSTRKIPERVEEFLKWAFNEYGVAMEPVRAKGVRFSYGWYCVRGYYVLVRPYLSANSQDYDYCRASFEVDQAVKNKLAAIIIYRPKEDRDDDDYWVISGAEVREQTQNFRFQSINIKAEKMAERKNVFDSLKKIFSRPEKEVEAEDPAPEQGNELVKEIRVLSTGELEARIEENWLNIYRLSPEGKHLLLSGECDKVRQVKEEIILLLEKL